jgi:hypothetical protein
MSKLTGAALDRAVANAMGLKSVHNCEKWVGGLTDAELMECTVFKQFDYDPPYIDKDGAKHVGNIEVSLRATYENINNKLKEKNTEIYKREWVGLTDEEKKSFWTADQMTQEEWDELFNAVEAKLKEKNT